MNFDFSNAELAAYGYRPGKLQKWCACCGRYHNGAANSFKCRSCAERHASEVERICRDNAETVE